jgi:acetyl esterase
MFAGVGTADPLLDDSRRLGRALDKLGVPSQVRYYPGEIHAFHAFVFRDAARRCWQEQFRFIDQYL